MNYSLTSGMRLLVYSSDILRVFVWPSDRPYLLRHANLLLGACVLHFARCTAPRSLRAAFRLYPARHLFSLLARPHSLTGE